MDQNTKTALVAAAGEVLGAAHGLLSDSATADAATVDPILVGLVTVAQQILNALTGQAPQAAAEQRQTTTTARR